METIVYWVWLSVDVGTTTYDRKIIYLFQMYDVIFARLTLLMKGQNTGYYLTCFRVQQILNNY